MLRYANPRKTVDITTVLEEGNKLLALPDSDLRTADFRQGIATLLEKLLHESGNYAGFQYLEWANGGFRRWQADGCPEGDKSAYIGDESKREYFGPRKK